MTNSVSDSPLGQQSLYVAEYLPSLLFPIERKLARAQLALGEQLPFHGVDIWTGYELSWLDERGKPVVAMAEFHIPFDSPNIIESKSFKLYLNSFNQTSFASADQVRITLQNDLSNAAGANISLALEPLSAKSQPLSAGFDGECIDDLPISVDTYQPMPELLSVGAVQVDEALFSHLLKTNCPVTGQPDWASIQVSYSGRQINREGLLRYIISFRGHQDFHEHCVERIFVDIMERCKPTYLSAYARYTRRGGLDINPFRSTDKHERPPALRLARQ